MLQGPAGPGLRLRPGGAITQALPRGQRGCSVSTSIYLLLIVAVSVVTWLGTAVRCRRRADLQARTWRRERAEMVARMGEMQDTAARARIRSAQATQATAEWSEGYKQGCRDMIKAMAALRGGTVPDEQDAGQAVSAN